MAKKEITFEEICRDITARKFQPVYVLMGEEPFFIDQITDLLLKSVLEESERDFNQIILYGADTDAISIINAARRFPMMSEYQLIVVREAQLVRDIELLSSYVKNPLSSTILVINYKYKTLDRRRALAAATDKNGILYESKKIPDYKMPSFITSLMQQRSIGIDPKAAQMLSDFLGNDLNRLNKELDKLAIILAEKASKRITPELIEQNIGISKEYNNFELIKALAMKDILKANRIAQYFEKNPKSNPIQMTLPVLFNYFSKIIFKNSAMYTDTKGKKSLSIKAGGLYSGENIAFAIEEAGKYKNVKKMQDLKIPIAIPAVDLKDSEKYVFTNVEKINEKYLNKADISIAVRASSSYPAIFAPCIYNKHKFVDGGILDNIPVEETRKIGADKVIAVKFKLNKTSRTVGIRSTLNKSIDIMFSKIESEAVKKADYVIEINTQDVNYENLEKRKKQLKNEIDSVISELDSTRYGKNEISKGFYDIESKRNIAVENLEKSVQAKEQNMQKLKQYEEEISKLTYTQRMKQARHQFLIETEKEKEGYNKTVKSLLVACDKDSNLNKGIHGVLANLISVEKEYETAIEMCLGQSLQNIVTSTEQDAKKMIEYLRTNSLGRASFLPIASVQGKKLDKLTKLDGVIGIASDLVKCKKEYEQIILSLLGRTVVVEDMDTAIALAKKDKYSFRIVTLKGDIISSSGSISGGSVQTKTVNILGRSREIEDLEKELKKLEKQIADKTAEKEEYASSIGDSIEETAKLE